MIIATTYKQRVGVDIIAPRPAYSRFDITWIEIRVAEVGDRKGPGGGTSLDFVRRARIPPDNGVYNPAVPGVDSGKGGTGSRGVVGDGAIGKMRRAGITIKRTATRSNSVARDGAVDKFRKPIAGARGLDHNRTARSSRVVTEDAIVKRGGTAIVAFDPTAAGTTVVTDGAIGERGSVSTLAINPAAKTTRVIAGDNAIGNRPRAGDRVNPSPHIP